jgi:hypothetical protein
MLNQMRKPPKLNNQQQKVAKRKVVNRRKVEAEKIKRRIMLSI